MTRVGDQNRVLKLSRQAAIPSIIVLNGGPRDIIFNNGNTGLVDHWLDRDKGPRL